MSLPLVGLVKQVLVSNPLFLDAAVGLDREWTIGRPLVKHANQRLLEVCTAISGMLGNVRAHSSSGPVELKLLLPTNFRQRWTQRYGNFVELDRVVRVVQAVAEGRERSESGDGDCKQTVTTILKCVPCTFYVSVGNRFTSVFVSFRSNKSA